MWKNFILTLILLSSLSITATAQLWDYGSIMVPGNDNARLLRPYGDYVFVSKYASQLMAMNVQDPCMPVMADQLYLNLHGYITIAENTLYLSGGSFTNSVFVIDITDPTNMTYLRDIESGSSCDLEARGDFLYIADNYGTVKIYDITQRENPVLVSTIGGSGDAYGLKLSEDYLYVASSGYGLKIYNIADPFFPELISSYSIGAGSYPLITKDENYVYLASYSGGYKIIDVENPASPDLVNTINLTSYDQQLSYSNNTLYTGNWYGGIYMIDVTDPESPVILDNVSSLSNGTFDVQIAGPLLHVADLGYFRVMGHGNNADGYYRKQTSDYAWDDITFTGDPWEVGNDTFTQRIEIGFDFPFYDKVYDNLFACSNGFIAFNDYSPSHWNTPMPCDTQPNNIIAPLWDNYSPAGSPLNIFTKYYANPERFVIEYHEMLRVGTTDLETFEIVLYPNGDIKFQYPHVEDASSVTIGIENETGTKGNEFAHNPIRSIPDSTAITFYRRGGLENNTGIVDIYKTETIVSSSVLSAAPNPFNPATVINYSVEKAQNISLVVYDIQGREIVALADGYHLPGLYQAQFDGSGLASGVYFVMFNHDGLVKTEKLILTK